MRVRRRVVVDSGDSKRPGLGAFSRAMKTRALQTEDKTTRLEAAVGHGNERRRSGGSRVLAKKTTKGRGKVITDRGK